MENKASIGKARKKARQLLKDFGDDKPPIMMQDLLTFIKENHDNFNASSFDFEGERDGLLLTQSDGESTLLYEKNNSYNRKRFTVAHEIGHFLLDHTQHGWNKEVDLDTFDPKEKEANEFAAELLMPLKHFKKDLNNGLKVEELAVKYHVSKAAAGWRAVAVI